MDRSKCADQDGRVRVTELQASTRGGSEVLVDGYLVPIDPMDAVQCESCQ